ncbi:MAG: SMP-30/gluconolactonase/LRE family protein [Chitinophagaceae bacterium]|nr:SMP-30/gluconolactonase/LRE family protein [Chitinophagaceae bacterium]
MRFLLPACLFFCFSCNGFKPVAMIERSDPALDAILSHNARVEVISSGYQWSEGPLWIESEKMLLFSDVPANTVFKWTEKEGTEVYLKPSGYTGTVARGGETGSNGLALNKDNKLVLCQHGNRQLAWMDAAIDIPKPVFKTIADNYQSKKFNSPNDLVYRSNGDLFFTDPPYGLEKNMDDPLKEMRYQGVFCVKASGEVKLLIDSLTRPNGIALTPDQKTLVIGNSDPEKPYWYAYDIAENDSLINPRIFFDSRNASKTERRAPDGFKFDKNGNMFASGPGGILIFDRNAKIIGKIKTSGDASNCALSPDEKTLYITANKYVLRIKMRE